MNDDEIHEAQTEAAKGVAEFIDMFDAPGVAEGVGRLSEAAEAYVAALVDAGLSVSDATRAAVGTVLKTLWP